MVWRVFIDANVDCYRGNLSGLPLLVPDFHHLRAMAGTNLIARLLTLPFTLLSLIFTRILRFRGVPYLRLAWPGSGNGSSSNGNGNGSHDSDVIIDPAAASKYFVRMLRNQADEPSAVDESSWFTQGGYNAALRKAKEDNLILCVVLTCRDHEDNAAFMR